jgi:hypothetical protein
MKKFSFDHVQDSICAHLFDALESNTKDECRKDAVTCGGRSEK